MREIKFRLIKDGKIVGYEQHSDQDGIGGIMIWQKKPEGDWFNLRYFPEGYILHDHKEQFIDLKDKNGVEIYEGDTTNEGIVEWCECLNWDSGGSLHPGFYFKDQYEFDNRGDLEYHTGFDKDIAFFECPS